jgi:DinB superfamily
MSRATLDELLRHLDDNRRVLRAAVDIVPIPDRERRPSPDRWSVAEVVEHLAIVEGRVTARLTEALEAAPPAALPAGHVLPPVDRSFLDRVGDRTNRFKTGAPSEPRGAMDAEAAWAAAASSREAFRRLLERADGLDVGGIVLPHPAFGPLTFYQWAVFLSGHDARHAEQIREIAALL